MIKFSIICGDLYLRWLTSLVMVREGLFLFDKSDNRVVFPAPDGPMMASISPGWQYPSELLRISLSLTTAETPFQVRVICLVGLMNDIILLS